MTDIVARLNEAAYADFNTTGKLFRLFEEAVTEIERLRMFLLESDTRVEAQNAEIEALRARLSDYALTIEQLRAANEARRQYPPPSWPLENQHRD